MKNLKLRIDDSTVLHSAFYIRNSKLVWRFYESDRDTGYFVGDRGRSR
jgi:hypothetical protein